MSEPFLGELKIVSFNFPPKGWALCNGQLLPINQNQPLFSLLGTIYGGDGRVNFALPDLRGRAPFHVGSSFNQGQSGGEVAHTLTLQEMPQHLHFATASTANSDSPLHTNNLLGAFNNGYRGATDLTTLAPTSISNV